jgi:hypothetical protein
MNWEETERLIERIRRERPELAAHAHASPGSKDQFFVRVSCVRKEDRQTIPSSVGKLYGTGQWSHYKSEHPEPFCLPGESHHTDALGRETDSRGLSIHRDPPPAEPVIAEAMLARIIALNRADPDWRGKPEKVAEMAAAWGARTDERGLIADFEAEEVARLAPDCHASVLIARTGSGLFASGFAARWGDGSTIMAPSVGSVPFDGPLEARRAAFRDLFDTLSLGAKSQERQLLLQAVKERERGRGLFD